MVTDAVDEFYNPQINSWWPRLGPSLVLESREEALQQSVSRQIADVLYNTCLS